MSISKEDVKYIAKLAKLKFNEEEAEVFASEFENILEQFKTLDKLQLDNVEIERLFDVDDVLNYEAYSVTDCPFCKKGHRIEAMVNGYGYSKL